MLSLWLLAAFLPVAGFAVPSDDTDSDWLARTWQSDDGLPSDTVTGVAQTADGFVWVTTANRLARFDGVEFESFSTASLGLKPLDTINPLLHARDDSLWIGTSRGVVVRVKNGVPEVFTNLPRHFIRTLAEGSDGAIWATDVRGNVDRLKDGVFTAFGPKEGWVPGESTLACDNRGELWYGRGPQLGVFRDGSFQFMAIAPSGNVLRIAARRAGGLWVCTSTQLFRYTEDAGLIDCGTFKTATANGPSAVLEDRSGAVWIGTYGFGLFRYDGKTFDSIPLSHHDIRALMEDREGFIWAAMDGGGLNRISPRVARMEGGAVGLPSETVTSVAEDQQGNIWAATKNGPLACRLDGTWQVLSTNADWPGGMASTVTVDADSNVWIGTKGPSTYRWRDGRVVETLQPGKNLPILSYISEALLTCRNGDVWIAPSGVRLMARWRDGRLMKFPLTNTIGGVQAFTEDSDGHVWFGSTRGVLGEIIGDDITNRTELIPGRHAPIRCLCANSNAIWMTFSEGGVGRLKDGHFSRVSLTNGLPEDSISQMIADNIGWYWFGSDHGIFKVRMDELEDVADGRATNIHPVSFGQNQGLKSLEASFGDSPNVWRARDGKIWMPMRMGLVSIDPGRDREDSTPPMPVLKQIAVDDLPVAGYRGIISDSNYLDLRGAARDLELSPSHRRLDFSFTALSFVAPENIHFRYRLQGFDNEWIAAGTRRIASYSRLPAGLYQFEVNACHADGVWSPATATVPFKVAPFFWQTWWFRLLAVALFTLAVIAAGRYVWFRRLQLQLRELEQKAALDKERARIAKDIHDDLGGSLTQTILLVKLAEKNPGEPEKTRQFLGQISAGVRQVVQSLDEIVWAANPGNDTLPHFIDYMGQFASEFLQAAGIRSRFDLPDDPPGLPLAPEIRHNLFLVLKEALNNIVRHANATEVRLQITVTGGQLQMIIRDNGKGFDDGPKSPSSDGLLNMRHRMDNIGGQCIIESKPGAGTTISASLNLPAA